MLAVRAWLESAVEPFFLFVHLFDPRSSLRASRLLREAHARPRNGRLGAPRGAAPGLRDILSHRPYSKAFVEPYRRESFALRRGRWKLRSASGPPRPVLRSRQ
jgi:hypothetical protein